MMSLFPTLLALLLALISSLFSLYQILILALRASPVAFLYFFRCLLIQDLQLYKYPRGEAVLLEKLSGLFFSLHLEHVSPFISSCFSPKLCFWT